MLNIHQVYFIVHFYNDNKIWMGAHMKARINSGNIVWNNRVAIVLDMSFFWNVYIKP